MGGCDIRLRGCPAGPDGPYRFIGDDGVGVVGGVRQRPLEPRRERRQCTSGIALLFRLADTDDGDESRTVHGSGFLRDDAVGLSMIRPAFGMSDDHRPRP